MKPILLTALAVLLAAMLPVAAHEVRPQPLECLECHDNLIAGSVHDDALLYCEDCHEDVVDESHIDEGAAPVDCTLCHDAMGGEAAGDIHSRIEGADPEDFPDCTFCHGAHEVFSPAESEDLRGDYCEACHDNVMLRGAFHAEAPVADETCLECHFEEEVYAGAQEDSVHQRFDCVACHSYVGTHLEAHQEDLPFAQRANCNFCHRSEGEQHRDSIHGISLSEGINEAANCWNCHGSHGIGPVDSPESPVHPRQLPETCGECHDDPELAARYDIPIRQPGKLYAASVHGKLVEKGRMDAATCVLCHGVHDIKSMIQPDSPISPFHVPETCGECHGEESEAYQQSIHWVRARKGVRDSPVCNDCHSEHSIQAITTLNGNGEARRLQEETCINCHQDPVLARRFSIKGLPALSYQDSYHGLAVMRGDPDAAMCVDCHRTHAILPERHAQSSINMDNRVETCRQCHENANVAFVQSYTHETAAHPGSVIEYWVQTIYLWVIWIVIGGMLLHNGVIMGHEIRRRRRQHRGEVSLPRFTRNEVGQHALLTVSFLVLVVTGFALKYPETAAFRWLEWLGLTETLRQWIHRGAGVALLAVGVYHMGYLTFTARGRQVGRMLLLSVWDVWAVAANVAYHLGLRRTPPESGEFDYTEKAEYWALIWGTAIMGITGFVLWFPTQVTELAPVWTIKVSEIIHFYEAVLASLAILVWHWFFVIFHPSQYPLSFTMVDGRISLEDYKHHHRRSFRRLLLEWSRLRAGQVSLQQLSPHARQLLDGLRAAGQDPDAVLEGELYRDPELRAWVDEQMRQR